MPSSRHAYCARLLRAGYSPEEAMTLAGWSPGAAHGMAPHIVAFLTKNGHDVAPETTAPPAPAVPAGRSDPVVTGADVPVAAPVVTTTKPPARRGRPPKGKRP